MAGARGEATIQLADREVTVLFTNRALAEVEQKLGRSILATAQGLAEGSTGIGELVILLRAGMEAARRDAREPGPAVALNTAYDVMDEAGFGPVAVAVMEAVSAVLAWGTSSEDTDPNA
jgi:hypothetical protein